MTNRKWIAVAIAAVCLFGGLLGLRTLSMRSGSHTTTQDSQPLQRPSADRNAGKRGESVAVDPTGANAGSFRSRYDAWRNAVISAVATGTDMDTSTMALLAAQLRDDPDLIRELADLFETETDPHVLRALSVFLAQNGGPFINDKELIDRLLRMAEQDTLVDRKIAALLVLAALPNPSKDLAQRIALLSREDPERQVRMGAVNALGSWAHEVPSLRSTLLQELVEAHGATDDPGIRGFAIHKIVVQQQPQLPASVMEAMQESVLTEQYPHNRSLAALTLGQIADPSQRVEAFATLRSAFDSEQDPLTRRHLIGQLLRSAEDGRRMDVLNGLQSSDPITQKDIEEYRTILNSGETDINRIIQRKSTMEMERQDQLDVVP